jgi:hypothetical protein
MLERERKLRQWGRFIWGAGGEEKDERSFPRFRQAHVADEDTCKALNSVI